MSRYLEKDFLCSYDLSEKFFEKLDLEILDIQPLRKVFILKTIEGEKILKKVDYDQNKIKFIDTSLEYINKNFKNTMKINKMKDGQNYLRWNEDFYILMDRLSGIEATVTNPLDIEICAKTIANIHKASNGIIQYLEENNSMVIRGDNMIEWYKNAKNEIIEISEFVSRYKNKNEFDSLFLESKEECINQIENCIEKLEKSDYLKMILDERFLAMCHNDLAHHNFLIENGEGSIIDFDYSNINLRAMDVADLILKWIKNSTFDREKANELLNEYNKVVKLEERELELIKIFLAFPRDLYSIFRIYYKKEKTWEYGSYLNKLKVKLENDRYRRIFIKEF